MSAAGSSFSFRVYARAFVVSARGEVLMLKKSASQSIAPGVWLIPGGAVEFGEAASAAVTRELQEETGVVASEVRLIGEDFRVIDGVHWQGLLFSAIGDVSALHNREPAKHDALEWKSLNFARSVMSPREFTALSSLI